MLYENSPFRVSVKSAGWFLIGLTVPGGRCREAGAGRPLPRPQVPAPGRALAGELHDAQSMTSLPALLLLLVIAAVCGAVGRAIAGGTRGGILVSIILGFIGAFLGSWIAHRLKLPEPLLIHFSGHSFPLLWSIIGAALFVAIIHLISGRR
jgi:uncharacterized membrane protein YeaQ/YmgE (transglycosylase-associated protein family)